MNSELLYLFFFVQEVLNFNFLNGGFVKRNCGISHILNQIHHFCPKNRWFLVKMGLILDLAVLIQVYLLFNKGGPRKKLRRGALWEDQFLWWTYFWQFEIALFCSKLSMFFIRSIQNDHSQMPTQPLHQLQTLHLLGWHHTSRDRLHCERG